MTSHALKSFWKCYEKLPAHIQTLADKNFALFKANPSLDFSRRAKFTPPKSVAATVPWLASGTATTIGSGSAPTRSTTNSGSKLSAHGTESQAELTRMVS